MKADPKVIEHLNTQLTNELTAVNQYFLHARTLRHWGVTRLGKKEYDESIEARVPETLVPFQPFHGFAHRFDGEVDRHGAAGLGAGDEACVGQDIQVLHHPRQLLCQGAGQLAHRQSGLLLKPQEDGPAGRIAEGIELGA